MHQIFFEEISPLPGEEITKFLYNLLLSKDYSISHEKMPSYESHKKFVAKNPYFKWFVLRFNNILIGSLYINCDNSVAITLMREYKFLTQEIIKLFEESFEPQSEIKSYRYKDFFFNVNPNDNLMIDTLKKCGYQLSQITFKKNT